ncbi:sulfurtransferase-like selenium metabolism protein YedF [Desulfoprunum benzoelyticum]|uniref:Selenium metabolism protein YedF n=1 Tax=Desulfoprunum benzoelyticum TaxID=1506996 RepID=A0A840USN4_9BACT|nr:sulfurtransferase-like selenium metabolism protein YedF [Desulfoprunum benzoelyticum]MBB5347846.1 selenium metabolism protein YedF [Desulfoprunum benzoelyticum]MBM9530707.1 sulfurtransferase-like selenium metabolism protein YedF [Desulfoprunum benzoelyticum]
MKIIDCRGMNCPEPVLQTRQAMAAGAPEGLAVIVDNEGSKDNVERFARSQGCTTTVTVLADGQYRVEISGITAGAASTEVDPAVLTCPPTTIGPVCIIPADSMGRGSEELGWALLQNYVKTLRELSPLPSRIFFYNGGVKIVATDNKAVEAVIEMERRGVEIWACGTCLEYFHLEKDLKVGRITNMFDIVNTMATAARVISPY